MSVAMLTYPCCSHCEPEADGKCWAADVGHGAYCTTCQMPSDGAAPLPPALGDPA